MQQARDLYWTCLAEDPEFAPAWAGLGRCCWFLDKFAGTSSANVELAQAAFQRAFLIDPGLASAHQFYTYVQADTGHADEATSRLLKRLRDHPDEPESFAGLVHVLRFSGLLEQSAAAHERAIELDPAVVTGVAHTFFFMGEFARAIETYGGRAGYYLDAAAWAALGEEERAVVLLRERLGRMSLSRLMTALLESLLAILEGRTSDAVKLMEAADTVREPEILIYFARHYAHIGMANRAMDAVKQAQQSGFVCAPQTLRSDTWFSALRKHSQFKSLLKRSEGLVEAADRATKALSERPLRVARSQFIRH
jgi:tetratricopeptide (TPR) repeat protein